MAGLGAPGSGSPLRPGRSSLIPSLAIMSAWSSSVSSWRRWRSAGLSCHGKTGGGVAAAGRKAFGHIGLSIAIAVHDLKGLGRSGIRKEVETGLDKIRKILGDRFETKVTLAVEKRQHKAG